MADAAARVALATAPELPQLDEDGPALRAALGARGVDAGPVIWDDPAVDWSGFDLVVVRSVWDAARRRAAFLDWAQRVARATRLVNRAEVLRWNTDKRYLLDLERGGAPIVPTRFFTPQERVDLPAAGDWVVKPAVSSGALDTARYRDDGAELEAHVRRLLAQGRVVMLQPYLEQIDEGGETALVFFHGTFSHAIRKGPILRDEVQLVQGLYAAEDIGPREASAQERSAALEVLAALPFAADGLTYARVDLVPGPGRPLLLELELAEPSLFLGHAPGAAERLADAIVVELGR